MQQKYTRWRWEKVCVIRGHRKTSRFPLEERESNYHAQEFPFWRMSAVHRLSFWTVMLSGRGTHGFSKASHLPDVISMWIFLFKAQLFYLKILRGTVRSSCKMSIFKEESFRRQRVRSKQCKNRESRESKGGRKGGKGFGFASLQRNCFDTVSPLHEFSICLCQIHYFKPQSCQMLIFYGVLTWQANLSVESVSFSQSQDLQPRKMYMLFWPKVSTLQQEWVGKANHYILVPNNCYQNQCFYMKKIKHYEQHKK